MEYFFYLIKNMILFNMDNDIKTIKNLIELQDEALAKIVYPMDSWINIDMDSIPFYFEEDISKFKNKCWIKIDPDIYFEKMLEKMTSFEPLFSKTSSEFKKQLKSAMFSSFNCVNSNDDRELKLKSKKYPSWARFWFEFCTGAGLNGYIPWENVNDRIVFEKYDSFIQDQLKCDELLGFKFYTEYRKLKTQNFNQVLDKKYKDHKNAVNKKVS